MSDPPSTFEFQPMATPVSTQRFQSPSTPPLAHLDNLGSPLGPQQSGVLLAQATPAEKRKIRAEGESYARARKLALNMGYWSRRLVVDLPGTVFGRAYVFSTSGTTAKFLLVAEYPNGIRTYVSEMTKDDGVVAGNKLRDRALQDPKNKPPKKPT
jgi:hypothetical protein